MAETVVPGLERRLKAHLLGEVNFDAFTRGRYATDASHYQVMPVGVVAPRSIKEAEHALALAREEGVSVLPRGAGTSQSGQTVNASLVIDCSRHLDHMLALDVSGRRCTVEPGIVLDELNRRLRPHGLWFPVDISTASRATIGGMVGNNSCGARSLRYGNTRENVRAIDAVLADGAHAHFGPAARDLSDLPRQSPLVPLARDLLAIAAREADTIEANFPKVQRRVGGYNLDALVPGRNDLNLAHILVGSEGTLAFSTKIELKLAPLLGQRAVGACHFGSFVTAMDAAQHIVKLGPIAVELVDRTMLGLARDIAMFKPTIDAVVRGNPAAILFVEFAEEDQYENLRHLIRLKELMGELGLGWDKTGAAWGGVVDVFDARLQAAITDMRTAGLNIMMSMKEEGKPISFVEDCAVPLEHLADYTSRLTAIFEKHGTRGTWYAHASVGCLHVRPVLNLRLEHDVKAMRAIAEEAFDMVKAYKGSHSGEHGDGIVRSEFHDKMFGPALVRAFEEVKASFDPDDRFNPGKIVHAPDFDDRTLFRYAPDYHVGTIDARLDWSAYPGAGGGIGRPVEPRIDRPDMVVRRVTEQRAVVEIRRMHDLAGIEAVVRIEARLDLLERAHQRRPEHLVVEFRAHDAVAVLARMRALVGLHHVEGFLGDRAHRLDVVLEPQVEHRPHVQAADRGVGIPSAAGAVLLEDGGEPRGIVRQMLERDRAVLDERDRFALLLHRHHDVEAGGAHLCDGGLQCGIENVDHPAPVRQALVPADAEIVHQLLEPHQAAQVLVLVLLGELDEQDRLRIAAHDRID